MKNRTVLGVLGAIVLCISVVYGLNEHRESQIKSYVETAKSHPDLAVSYPQVSALRISSRKSTYRRDEILSLDIALINLKDQPIFFHKLTVPTLEVRADDKRVLGMTTVLEGVATDSFDLVEPDSILKKSFQIFCWCNDPQRVAFVKALNKVNEDERESGIKYQKALFDKNLFVNWGEACLDVSPPGTYALTAEVDNEDVVVSGKNRKIPTAVGSIKSNTLWITITP